MATPLLGLLEDDTQVRGAAVYGRFGAATNVTDGRYTCFRYPENIADQELFEHTLMPTHQRAMFVREEFEGAELVNSFAFLRGFPVMVIFPGQAAAAEKAIDSVHGTRGPERSRGRDDAFGYPAR